MGLSTLWFVCGWFVSWQDTNQRIHAWCMEPVAQFRVMTPGIIRTEGTGVVVRSVVEHAQASKETALNSIAAAPDSTIFLAMSILCWCRDLVPLCFCTLLLAASRVIADGNVTLQSLIIYNTHEWFGLKPKVYFQCAGDAKVNLPDIKAKNQLYAFEGQESWQPLTKLIGTKCRRCGLYEEDSLNPDDVFDQWELCPLDFNPSPDGRYFRFKQGEFNLTLSCSSCSKFFLSLLSRL